MNLNVRLMNDYVEKTYQSNLSVINFMQSCLSDEVIPKTFISKIHEKIIRKESESLIYRQTEGEQYLREYISSYYFGNKKIANKMLITSGAQQALYLIIKNIQNKLKRKLTIAIEEYSYIGFTQIIEDLDCKVVKIPINNDGLDLDYFKKIANKTKIDVLYIIPDLQNPTGITYKNNIRKEIIKIQKKYNFSIIEDVCYRDFIPEQKRLELISPRTTNGYTVGSFSKTMFPSLRIGWLYTKDDFSSIVMFKREIDLFSSFITQRSVMIFFRDFYKKYTNLIRNYTNIKNEYTKKLLEINKIDHFYKISENKFGIHIWLSKINGENAPLKDFQKQGLIIGNGSFFKPGDNSHIRLCISRLTLNDLKESIIKLTPILTNKKFFYDKPKTNILDLKYKSKILKILIQLKFLELIKIIKLK